MMRDEAKWRIQSFIYLYLSFKFIALFIKIVFPWHHQLLDNASHRKNMRTRFSLCYNVSQTQVTFKYRQDRRALKYGKHKYNDILQKINPLILKDKFVIFLICR